MQIIKSEIIERINPFVSVDIITYNHEKFIKEALEGILMQKTNFIYEIVICDDYSTDGTRDILIRYQKKYPDKITLRFQDKNVGLRFNYFENKKACRGKYIAICEGDDYWTDSNKLQKQVDLMEKNPEFSMCFSNALEVFDFDNWKHDSRLFSSVEDRIYTGNEILANWIIATASVLYRNNIRYDFKYLDNFIFYDTPLFLILCENGKICGMSDQMVVYRRHENAITCNSSTKVIDYSIFKHLNAIDRSFNGKYYAIIKTEKAKEYFIRAKKLYKRKSVRFLMDGIFSIYYDSSVLFNFIRLKWNGSR